VAIVLLAGSAQADEPSPVVVEPPLPDPRAPSPIKIEMPPEPGQPPPGSSAVQPATPPPKPANGAPAPETPPPVLKRKTRVEFGFGPTYFGTTGKHENNTAGATLQIDARVPFGDQFGLDFRWAWALTEWDRTVEVAKPGYKIARWTTHAYSDVWDWAGRGPSSDKPLRAFGAFFAFIFLVFPYVFALPFYAVSPLAATTDLEADIDATWDFGDDPKGDGPYIKGGLGLMGFFHPTDNHLYGGVGPNAGFGYRASGVSIGFVGTYLPPLLHGGPADHVYTGSFVIGFGH
jgi:hypothetical protein